VVMPLSPPGLPIDRDGRRPTSGAATSDPIPAANPAHRKAMNTRRIIVTGGCGFIGSAVVRHLVEQCGVEVLNIDKLTYAGDPATVAAVAGNGHYRFARADICDGAAVRAVLTDFQPDAVIHLAAETHVDRSIDKPVDFLQTNIVGTFTLLEACRDYWSTCESARRDRFRFLYVSTDEVFGALSLEEARRFSRDDPYRPNSPYAASKAAADHLVRAWHRTYQLPTLISNCSNNYGPWQFPEKLVPTMIIAGLEGRPMPVYGTGTNVRDWLHVEDHVDALTTCLMHGEPGQSYLIGGDAATSNLALVSLLCRILDEDLPHSPHCPHASLMRFVPDRPGHDLRYDVDTTHVRATLGWQPRRRLEEGLRATVAWYRENRTWWADRLHQSGRVRRGLAHKNPNAPQAEEGG